MEGLFIVRRDQSDLYDYLRRRYRDVPEMTVVLDRRRCERRIDALSMGRDRRQTERRTPPAASWDALGYVIVAVARAALPAPCASPLAAEAPRLEGGVIDLPSR
jgi:hypothetical protein